MILFVGCSNSQPKKTLEYETKVIDVTQNYVDCGELKLKNLDVKLEDPKQHPGSVYNQKIVTHNLIILDHKLREAESLLNCYKNQVKRNSEIQK